MHNEFEELMLLLTPLAEVEQDPAYHPEGDALYHSLQVFGLALDYGAHGELLAAALLHDVGKATGPRDHARAGAEDLQGRFSHGTTWLVRRHMDLLRHPRRTRRALRRDPRLRDLELLRRWDLGGRDPLAGVLPLEEAVGIILSHHKCAQIGGQIDHEKEVS